MNVAHYYPIPSVSWPRIKSALERDRVVFAAYHAASSEFSPATWHVLTAGPVPGRVGQRMTWIEALRLARLLSVRRRTDEVDGSDQWLSKNEVA